MQNIKNKVWIYKLKLNSWVIDRKISFHVGKYELSEVFFIIKSLLVLAINESETLTFHNDMRFLKEKAPCFNQLKFNFL